MRRKRPKRLLILLMGLLASNFLILSSLSAAENLKYEIWVKLDNQEKMLHGKERLFWSNKTSDEIKEIWFHLYYNAFKNEKSTLMQEAREQGRFLGLEVGDGEWGWIEVTEIKLADGRDLKPSMEFITPDEPLHPDDQTVMRVILPEPLMPGKGVELELEFQAKIPKGILRSGYYKDSYFISQWFPKPGVYEEGKGWNCHEYHLNSEFYADFADFTVHITVPENFVVGASGKMIEAARNKEEKAMTYTFYQENIHDFAWTADPRFLKIERDFIASKEITEEEYTEIAHRLGLPVAEVRLNDVRMILLIEPEHKVQIERHFKALKAAIKYYGLWYGPYPYETITMVDPPFRTGSGGMEYPTLFTAGTGIIRNERVLSPEGVIVHEYGHGYWYGLCANNEFEEAWLDEGINSYSESKVLEKAYGKDVLSFSINRIPLACFLRLPEYFGYELDRALAIHVVKIDPIMTESWKFMNRASYTLNVYMRAETCLHTLERVVGEDMMLRILRTFQTRFRFKHPRTEDFIAVVNEVTGRDFTWFFDELFFRTLDFDYGLSSLVCEKKPTHWRGVFDFEGRKEELTKKEIRDMEKKERKEKRGEKEKDLYITRLMARRFGEARIGQDLRLKLKVVFEDGSEEIREWDGQERWELFVFEKNSPVLYAQLDPETIWLIDSNLTNNSIRRNPSRGGILKLTSRVFFWIQNLLQTISGWS